MPVLLLLRMSRRLRNREVENRGVSRIGPVRGRLARRSGNAMARAAAVHVQGVILARRGVEDVVAGEPGAVGLACIGLGALEDLEVTGVQALADVRVALVD